MTVRRIGALALAGMAVAPAAARAATLTVDDLRDDCPSAGYTSVQAAVDAASPGDTVAICPGTYEEGPATVPNGGANAVSIAKMITLKGAGAAKVTIRPKPALASLLGTTTTYRNTTGAVIAVYRSGVRQIVDISGVTVEGGSTTVGAGVKFFNAEGSLTGSVIRNVAPLTGPQGYGVVIASNLVADRIPVRVAGTQISGFAKAGVVLDSTQAAPQLGVLAATISGNTITGAGPQAQTAQQGVLATGLVSGAISGNAITGNVGADDAASAGVRLVDLDLTPAAVGGTTTKLTATGNNIAGNGYGARNETAAGADQPVAFTATGNWWGNAAGPSVTVPKTAGDLVNGAAINFSGFRTTPIAAPAVPTAISDAAPTGELDSPTGTGVVKPGVAYWLYAFADDDFGVKSVAFKAGATDLGTDALAPYESPVAWTPPAALAGQSVTLSATITDSSGQVTTRSVTVTVEGTPTPTPTPTPTVTPTPTATPTQVSLPVKVSGAVGGALSLSLGTTAALGPFEPAVAKDYSGTLTATATSTVPGTTLSVQDPSSLAPGHLVNGTAALAQALRAKATSAAGQGGAFAAVSGTPVALLRYTGPVSADLATIELQQSIGASEPLLIGSYAKTLTFTLATGTP